jgi:hypothetical protein
MPLAESLKLPLEHSAKNIRVAPIAPQAARRIVERYHYSHKCVPNSQLHFGVFLADKCFGAMQFGPPIDKRKLHGLVTGTTWNGMLELNRMAFADALPRNSESRAMAIAFRLIRKQYPHIEWVVSFADATQCGDGAIYRAAGFVLTGIKPNQQILEWNGQRIAKKTLDNENYPRPGGKYFSRYLLETGQAKPLPGFQLRYIYFLNPSARERLQCPVLPFSAIAAAGALMYKGQRARSTDSGATGDQPEGGGANPTRALDVTAVEQP